MEQSNPATSDSRVLIYQGLGEKEAAIQMAEALAEPNGAGSEGAVEDNSCLGPSNRILLAQNLAHFDEHDRAITLLEELLPAPSWLTVHILEIDPTWDPLRNHLHFQPLLERCPPANPEIHPCE